MTDPHRASDGLLTTILQALPYSRMKSVTKCHEMTTRRSLTKSPKKKTRIEVTRGNTTVTIYLGRYNKLVRGKTLAYPQFTLVYFEHGVRRRQTFADRAKAEDEAAKVATRIENNERDVLKLKNTDQSSYAHATRMLEPLGIPLHAAIEEYVKAREVLGGTSLLVAANDYVRRHNEKLIERTVEQAVKELLKAKEHDRMSLRYIQTLRTHLNRFAQAFRSPISGVTARDIDGCAPAMQFDLGDYCALHVPSVEL